MKPPTIDEVVIVTFGLDASENFGWRGVRNSQLSIARHTGAAMINGTRYTYFPEDDSLWRDDVIMAVKRLRKSEAALDKIAEVSQQLGLYDGTA